MKEEVYLRLRVCLTARMDLPPESSSEGGLAIFVAQQALRGTNVSDYIEVDLSEPALALAANNASSLRCATQVVRRDFQEYINAASRRWDVIFIGFSFHHLKSNAKAAFAPQIRRVLGTGGEWIFFEPMLHGNETREDFLDRWQASLEHDWQEFTPNERTTIWEHVSQYDFPESLRTFERIAREGGFRTFEHLYTDPFCFYGAFRAVV